jgi:hypothetical protein
MNSRTVQKHHPVSMQKLLDRLCMPAFILDYSCFVRIFTPDGVSVCYMHRAANILLILAADEEK